MQVADFLQDEGIAAAAAQKSSTLLVRCSRLLKKRKILQPAVEPSSEDITALLSLDAPLAESIIRAGGGLLSWLNILPRSCFHLAVAGAVRDHAFELTRNSSKYMNAIAGGLKGLQPPLKRLKAVRVAPSGLLQVVAPLRQVSHHNTDNLDISVPLVVLHACVHVHLLTWYAAGIAICAFMRRSVLCSFGALT